MQGDRRTGAVVGAVIASTLLAIFATSSTVLAFLGATALIRETPAPPSLPAIHVDVTTGSVVRQVSASVQVERQFEWEVAIPAAESGQGIVTRVTAQAGGEIVDGGVVAVIDERPVFATIGHIPAFRSMTVGTTGNDVAQLQDGLRRLGYSVTDKPSLFGVTTARAAARFYLDRGFAPVDAAGAELAASQFSAINIRSSELVFAPSLPATAAGACGSVGKSAPDTLCRLTAGDPLVSISVPVASAAEVEPGQRTTLELEQGGTHSATIGAELVVVTDSASATVDEATDTSEEAALPTDEQIMFRVALDEVIPLTAGDAGAARIIVDQSPEDSLRVDAVAIRSDADGSTWLRTASSDRINIEVGLCDSGVCAIQGPQLRPNLRVEVDVTHIEDNVDRD